MTRSYVDQTHPARAVDQYFMPISTNQNQPVPNAGVSPGLPLPPPAHAMLPRTDAAPKSPRSDPDMAMTLTGAGERLEERLQPTLKEARLALDGAERAAEKHKLGIMVTIFALVSLGMVIMFVSALTSPSAGNTANLILGALLPFTTFFFIFAYRLNEMALAHVHELKLLICELEAFIFANRPRHYAVVDLEIEGKVAGYPRRLVAIMENAGYTREPERRGLAEGVGQMKTTVVAEKTERKMEKLAV